jgi:hypothetical protein
VAAEKFFFAWINSTEEFDPNVHAREDEDVYGVDLSGTEGDFDGLTLEIRNPRIGLLNPARKVWCILSFYDGGAGDPEPLFKGRLLGVPSNLFATIVTLSFTARPEDFNDQKIALAETMKELPYYDPIFVNPDSWGDPDVVLEAYSRLWHIDPVTGVVSTTDFLVGEDGTEVVTSDQHFYDDMEVTLNTAPARSVSMVATIPWQQDATGVLNLTRKINALWAPDQLPSSFTMKGLIDSWPKPGDDFGSGWQVASASISDVSYIMPEVVIPDIFRWQGIVPDLPIGSVVFPLKVTGEYHAGETAGFDFNFELVIASRNYATIPEFTVTYTAGRAFGQIVTFTMFTDQQAVVTMPGDDEALAITLNANPVSDLTEDGTIPIEDVRRRSYVHTARGLQSIEYLLLIARAHLIAKSRAVETKFVMGFKDGLRLRSLRKNAQLFDERLPGGVAVGKIVGYRFSLSGDDGAALAEITIGSAVGYGGAYTTVSGQPHWVDDGWVDDPWQERIDEVRLTDTADIQFTIPPFASFDDGIDFLSGLTADNAVLQLSIANLPAAQEAVILGASNGPNTDQSAVSTVLQTVPTQITCQLVPMEGGPFKQEVVVSVSDLIVPKQIDLEAASNA